MTTDDLLKAICGIDDRPICQNPWTISVDGVIYSAATDGMRILFIADATSPYPAPPDASVFAKHLDRTTTDRADAHELRRADLLAEIGDGAPVDWGNPCKKCLGNGYKECNLGHEHDCTACDGSGSVNGANSYSLLRQAPLSITTGDRIEFIDMQLLRGVIANLPGDPIRVGLGAHRRCFFSSDGWLLVIMAMNFTEHRPDIRSIQARTNPPGGPHDER
jgi:hypothetical protein